MSGSIFGDDLPTFGENLQRLAHEGASVQSHGRQGKEPVQVREARNSAVGWRAEARARFGAVRSTVRRTFFKRRAVGSRSIAPASEVLVARQPAWKARVYAMLLYVMGIILTLPMLFVVIGTLGSDHSYWLLATVMVLLTGYCYINGYQAWQFKGLPSRLVNRTVPESKAAAYHLRRVHGVAGDLSSARDKFSASNIATGEAGEKATAVMLEPLAEIPGVRIYHGVHWPGTEAADLDHVITGGNRIAVIDSKAWSGVLHEMDSAAQVTSTMETGGKDIERTIRIHRGAQALMKEMGPSFKVHAYLAVHPVDPAVQPQFRSAPGTPVAMASAEETVESVRRFILGARGLGRVPVDDIDLLSAMVHSPLEAQHVAIEPDVEYRVRK